MKAAIPVQAQRAIMQAFQLRDQGRLAESLTLAQKLHKSFPTEPNTLYLLGSIHTESNELDKAAQFFQKGANADKKGHINQGGIGLVHLKQGNYREALKWLKIANKRAPQELSHLNNLALASMEAGKINDASALFEKVLKQAPKHKEALINYARLLKNSGAGAKARQVYQKAIALYPNDAEILCSYAQFQMTAGDLDIALESYQKARKNDPQSIDAHIGLIECLGQKGDEAAIKEQVQSLLAIDPDNLFAISTLLKMKAVEDCFDDDKQTVLNHFDQVIRSKLESGDDQFTWLYNAVEVEEALGNHDFAFDCLEEANRRNRRSLQAHGHRYDHKGMEAYVEALVDRGDWENILATVPGSEDSRPVFVVGMPRSGTTLIEQIIAAHPEADGAGERMTLFESLNDLSPPTRGLVPNADWVDKLVQSDAEALTGVTQRYLALYDRDYSDARKIVDKLPYNFLAVGLALALFPNAAIIHCVRDRQATGLSIYKQRFAAPYVFDTDLNDIRHLYDMHDRLMDFWKTLEPKRIHTVQYETLVSDAETQAGRIIDHIGLEWDPACLKFHEAARTVRTASMHQIREGIQTSAMEKYRIYESRLAPLNS